ncbi:hypothetical protein GCM10022249_01680 [Enteractinococcus coprophilus]
MRTIRDTEYSSLYFSDPCLQLSEKLELAWYTGWENLDLYPIIADWITQAAAAVGASQIFLVGASGGGLAALQIATYLPNSTAVPFNSQTSISGYLVKGTRYSAQRAYLNTVMPQLKPSTPLEDLPQR